MEHSAARAVYGLDVDDLQVYQETYHAKENKHGKIDATASADCRMLLTAGLKRESSVCENAELS